MVCSGSCCNVYCTVHSFLDPGNEDCLQRGYQKIKAYCTCTVSIKNAPLRYTVWGYDLVSMCIFKILTDMQKPNSWTYTFVEVFVSRGDLWIARKKTLKPFVPIASKNSASGQNPAWVFFVHWCIAPFARDQLPPLTGWPSPPSSARLVCSPPLL